MVQIYTLWNATESITVLVSLDSVTCSHTHIHKHTTLHLLMYSFMDNLLDEVDFARLIYATIYNQHSMVLTKNIERVKSTAAYIGIHQEKSKACSLS